MNAERIDYVEKSNMSLGACIRRAVKLGKASGISPFHYRVVDAYDRHGRVILGVEVVRGAAE